MGGLLSKFLSKETPKTPISGFGARIKNVAKNNYRGLIGLAVPLASLTWQGKKEDIKITVCCMWFWMFWFFLLQPVNIPVTSLIPVFLLPMAGVMNTDVVCKCYMNEGILFFIFSNMVLLLLNNSGCDRRLALWFICSGDASQFSGKRLVFKFSSAAFILSIFSSRLITCSSLTKLITPTLMNLQATEPRFKEMRYIINSAIQTSCAIGSIALIHGSFAVLTFRAIYYETYARFIFPDKFNYLEYSSFAFPVAIVIFILNCFYHTLLMGMKCKTPIPNATMVLLRTTFMNFKKDIPKSISLHEKLTVFFLVLYLFLCFFRWNRYFTGWSNFEQANKIPGIKDATVAAMFVILLHSLPKGYSFIKIFTVKKRSELGQLKPESGILWWRFVDKHIVYGYLFLIGSGVALSRVISVTGVGEYIKKQKYLDLINEYNWPLASFITVFCSVLCGNIMSGVAACCSMMPLIMNLPIAPLGTAAGASAETVEADALRTGGVASIYSYFYGVGNEEKPPIENAEDVLKPENALLWKVMEPWLSRTTLLSLATGLGTGLGVCFPFLFTPAYFCYFVGKVPKKQMAKYGLGTAIICIIVIWIAITFYAPLLWDSSDLIRQIRPGEKMISKAAGAAAGAAAGEAAGAAAGAEETTTAAAVADDAAK